VARNTMILVAYRPLVERFIIAANPFLL
jgi:hypothetical protein